MSRARAFARGFARGGMKGALLFLVFLAGVLYGTLALRLNVWWMRLWVNP